MNRHNVSMRFIRGWDMLKPLQSYLDRFTVLAQNVITKCMANVRFAIHEIICVQGIIML